MSILISVLLIVEVLAAFLLIVVILAQKSKDQGLGMAFGGGMGESLFGSRAGNVLTRMTVTLATVFMVTTIVLGILFARGHAGGSGSVMDRADREMPAPAAPAAAAAAPMQPAPMVEGQVPVAPVAEASAPMVLQMGEGGELTEVATEAVAIPAPEGTLAEEPAPAPALAAEAPAEEEDAPATAEEAAPAPQE